MLTKECPCAVIYTSSYDAETVRRSVKKTLIGIGISQNDIDGKNIVIKPNLVRKSSPEKAITTHPALLGAVISVLHEYNAKSITIAESPGGLLNESILKSLYSECGVARAASEYGAVLNYDTSASLMKNPSGEVCKAFNIMNVFQKADVLINLCKLKTHELTLMSCAVKNFFGTIPGIEKFEMHARYTSREEFQKMLCDLCAMISDDIRTVNIVDAVVGMEGSGPTAGAPRAMNFIAASENPFVLDTLCAHILGVDGRVLYMNYAFERGYTKQYKDIKIYGDDPEALVLSSLKLPDTEKTSSLRFSSRFLKGRTIKLFEPKPYVTKKCISCGVCARSCPMHTITIDQKKKKAVINREKCIRCYCCQELCPHTAIRIKKNFILKIIK